MTQGKYILVKPINYGKEGEVWYTFSKDLIIEAQLDSPSDAYVASLIPQLVAIKIHHFQEQTGFKKAVRAVKQIYDSLSDVPGSTKRTALQDKSNIRPSTFKSVKGSGTLPTSSKSPHPSQFLEILDVEADTAFPWFTMKIVPGVSINHLLNFTSLQQAPAELTGHIALEISTALQWLHNTVRVSVNDLFCGNVMLDDTNSNHLGLPNVVLIDCGQAIINLNEEDKKWDCAMLHGEILHQMAFRDQPCIEVYDWEATYGGAVDNLDVSKCSHGADWAAFMKELGRYKKIATEWPPDLRVQNPAEFHEQFLRHARSEEEIDQSRVQRSYCSSVC